MSDEWESDEPIDGERYRRLPGPKLAGADRTADEEEQIEEPEEGSGKWFEEELGGEA